ncbi:MAG: hypothetical protein GF341_12890, partial [candidate division Zixibacteria bacterium]|nr:hypothetical protein [candidate division Zixibacteria bacterium]
MSSRIATTRRMATSFLVLAVCLALCLIIGGTPTTAQDVKAGGEAEGTRSYDDYETPAFCGSSCHTSFYRQWEQAMMSQAYTHHWDEIEYFKL